MIVILLDRNLTCVTSSVVSVRVNEVWPNTVNKTSTTFPMTFNVARVSSTIMVINPEMAVNGVRAIRTAALALSVMIGVTVGVSRLLVERCVIGVMWGFT